MKRIWLLALLTTPTLTLAQINAGTVAPTTDKPFTVTKVTTFNMPWRIAFLPDGRMLVTEKPGKVFIVTQEGAKTEVTGVPAVQYGGQNGLLGIYLAPTFDKDRGVYLTYTEPDLTQATSGAAAAAATAPGPGRGRGPQPASGLALAHATLDTSKAAPALTDLKVIWRDPVKGGGGQAGGAIAFSPDKTLLYLTVGDRQRFTPAQDPDQPVGKILRLTLDGKPAPGNPQAGKTGASTINVIGQPSNTETAKTAPVLRTQTLTTPNLTLAETWSTGHRTPYGLAFAPDGRLWEAEHGPRGGDELNLIEPGKNYGWPLVSYGMNYDGVPIPNPDTRPDLAKPVIYWVPIIAPGNIMFYTGNLFPEWRGSLLLSGLGTASLNRIIVDGASAKPAERWAIGFRVRDVAQAPDGALWLAEDANGGGLYRLAPIK